MKKYHFAFSNMVLCLVLCMLCSGCGRENLAEEHQKVTFGEKTTAQAAEKIEEPADDYRGLLRIAEFSLKNSAGIRDEDGEFRDWIELENCSDCFKTRKRTSRMLCSTRSSCFWRRKSFQKKRSRTLTCR